MTSIARCQYVIRIRLVLQTFVHSDNSKGLLLQSFFRKFGCTLSSSAIEVQPNKWLERQTDPITSAFFLKSCFRLDTRGGQPRSNQRMIIWWPKTIISSLKEKTKATKKPGKGCYGPFQNTMPQISWIQDNVSRPSKKNFKTIYGA